MISLEKSYILTTLQKLPKNVRYLGKLIVAKGFKSCPKCKKSPNLVILIVTTDEVAAVAVEVVHLDLFHFVGI